MTDLAADCATQRESRMLDCRAKDRPGMPSCASSHTSLERRRGRRRETCRSDGRRSRRAGCTGLTCLRSSQSVTGPSLYVFSRILTARNGANQPKESTRSVKCRASDLAFAPFITNENSEAAIPAVLGGGSRRGFAAWSQAGARGGGSLPGLRRGLAAGSQTRINTQAQAGGRSPAAARTSHLGPRQAGERADVSETGRVRHD